jgi:predicted ATPase/signal transduction histidine kinase
MVHAFPGYRDVRRLHAGRRSTVDRVVRLRDQRTVILKQPVADLIAAEMLGRIQHEFDLLRAVRGPGVIEALELLRDGSRAALVLEDFGVELAHCLAERKFALLEVLDVGIAIASALAHIHAAGVVHKDINPSNIVYDAATRTVKLIDFDLATQTRGASAPGAAAMLQGTLHYLAPEQTGRLDRAIDERSDLYALGITLYELAVGRRPFEATNALALVHAHLAERPRRIDEIDPAIPSVVADIAVKLIAKAPEQRYQTAAGVRADLERCRRELAETGAIAPFAIARHDVSSRLEFPERLYGREPEIRALLDAFDRSARGAVETVLVSGYSGIGKSSVVRELVAPVAARRGYVASGKFEQLNRDVPYSAVVCALDQLLAHVLSEAAIDRWRTAIAAALGEDAALASSVLPAIERVLGPQPPGPALESDLARRRLAGAIARLLRAFAGKDHPLVVFLDDVQWIDSASLQLLTQLATADDLEALLIVAAYRDNEVDAGHRFAVAVRDQERRGAKVSRIVLAPLTLAETTELVADTLRLPGERVGDAAAVIWRKTEGNPFFIRQFIHALDDEGCIAFDPAHNAFAIDLAAMHGAAITENVADLLARQLAKLPSETRAALVTAAAIGTEFDLATLATVSGDAPPALLAVLAPAVYGELIVPVAAQAWQIDDAAATARYRFQHDRIQQAAYEAAPPEARERLHLTIGRQLLSTATPEELDRRLFDVVHHLHRGLARIDDEAERARFVELALEAAQRARRAGAYDVAATTLRAAAQIRDPVQHHAAWFSAHHELAQVLSLGSLHLEAREVLRAASEHATDRELATLGALDVTICTNVGLLNDALVSGRRAAARLGVELPSDPDEISRQLAAELATIMAAVAERPIAGWIDLPAMTDPERLATLSLLINCAAPAYQREPALMMLLASKVVTLSLRHGNCAASARGYGSLATSLWVLGHDELSFEFGKLAVALVRRLDARALMPTVDYSFAAYVLPWHLPIEHSIERLHATIATSIEAGALAYGAYAALHEVIARMVRGDSLEEVVERARRYHKLCIRLGLQELGGLIAGYAGHARRFAGMPAAPGERDIDFADVEPRLAANGSSRTVLSMVRAIELERRYWAGDHAGVVELARRLAPIHDSLPGNVLNAEIRFYTCLSAIALDRGAADIAAYRADLARYAHGCPANFAAMSIAVDAELARVRGDMTTAVALYDAAIDAAAINGFLKLEAIVNELAARFWVERDKPAFAAVHLGKARDVCEHWGARARASELELKRRGLGAAADMSTTLRSTSAIASTLDLAALLKASQALATDVVLDRLLGRMMEIIIENTGAQAGSIVLVADGALAVHAAKRPDEAVSVGGAVPLAMAPDVSHGIVNYVTRTAECVVLGDATRHPTFRNDPYVRARRPRSVLCLPIAHQERTIGVVYLENNLVANAFTVERLDALGILVAQLAVSIENAMIFARLEDLVAERTRALTEANQQLREQSLVRERMESQLRLAQKLQSVGQLAAGIAHEINTPMQYIGDSLVFLDETVRSLLSLIGTYRESLHRVADPDTAAALARVEAEFDLDYLCENAPLACGNAREGTARVAHIVAAMKAFSHPDQREQRSTVLRAALENTLTVAHNAYRHIADVVTDFADIPEVVCHPGEVNQVFLNLVVNAAHAIEDVVKQRGGRGTITIRTWCEDRDTVVISVSDTGAGIPDAIRDRVFDPFFTTKDVGRGTGQGLALARTAIVDRHGGAISFETRLGEGTTFYVRLPVHGHPISHRVSAAS